MHTSETVVIICLEMRSLCLSTILLFLRILVLRTENRKLFRPSISNLRERDFANGW